MTPSQNTKTLSLCSLFSLLLFLHVHGSSAREIKVEEELQEQNEASHIHYPSQKDKTETGKPYITSYGGFKRETRPYITAYGNSIKANQAYLASYLHPQKDQKEKSEPYVTAYGASKRQDQPYITGYVTSKRENQPYITGYRTSKRENQPYITGYHTSKRESQPYITSYHTSNRENQPYITGYRTSNRENQPYITVSGTNNRENQPYITAYRTNKRENHPYTTAYRNGKKANKPYITAYGNGKKDIQGENPKESYEATYARDSKDSYAATYRKEESGNTDAAIKKVDHTEAFKTGFFALDDLYVGNTMTLQFPIEEFPHFLSRKEADSIPFSTSQLPSVLQLLSVPHDSPMAQAMRGTLEQCEVQPLTAERKVCVSSLESMIDFVRSIIGSDSGLDILTTTLPATSRGVPLQSLTVLEVSQDFYAPKWVACHPLPYPYAVFYCHFIGSGTKIFKVKLGSENGEQVEALGVCHLDTSEWDPDHILFKQLGFKAGEAPVCHFLPVKHLMWIPLPSEATM